MKGIFHQYHLPWAQQSVILMCLTNKVIKCYVVTKTCIVVSKIQPTTQTNKQSPQNKKQTISYKHHCLEF